MAATLTENGYRFEHPTMAMVLRDMRIPRTDPGPGDPVPNFHVTSTDGATIDKANLHRDRRPTLIAISKLFGLVRPSRRGIAAMVTIALLMVAVGVAIAVLV